ncbi:MAG: hypothetical protein DMF73_17845 [Acidobacteria bacterium]|nr:MAG: hypothetical protein DMF73_17845 [Acidobacteriota bacterium]
MKTDQQSEPAVFLQTVSGAVSDLKTRLQYDYERAYPDLAEIIHIVLDEEEAKAWDLSLFPHLLLPDLVEAHVEKLNLQPAETRHEDVFAPHRFNHQRAYEPAMALCG